MTPYSRFRRCCPALLAAIAMLACRPINAQPVGDIVERYLAARGGIEKIRAVRSITYFGAPRPNGRPGRWMVKARPSYWLVGDPATDRSFAEGFDGASWEFYADPGLVMRTSHAPAAAARRTAYFDDALVYFGEPGWSHELTGTEPIAGRPAFRIRVTWPNGSLGDVFVDKETWLVSAHRGTAQVHAFGAQVTSETRVSDYRSINGALFPMRFEEFDIATGASLNEGSDPAWQRFEANVRFPTGYFSPPAEPRTPLARMLNAVFASRFAPTDAMIFYRDFRADPATRGVNTQAGIAAIGFQCLKNGAVETAILLLEDNARVYPDSVRAHFGLGRAYRTAGREADAIRSFERAVAVDPEYRPARDALSVKPR